jgi:hypothetical protein
MGLGRVVVQENGGRAAEMSVSEFLALPLDQRVRLILEQQLHFYDEGGHRLSTAEGLKLLKSLREPSSPVRA